MLRLCNAVSVGALQRQIQARPLERADGGHAIDQFSLTLLIGLTEPFHNQILPVGWLIANASVHKYAFLSPQ
jgi:hypothetical protein